MTRHRSLVLVASAPIRVQEVVWVPVRHYRMRPDWKDRKR